MAMKTYNVIREHRDNKNEVIGLGQIVQMDEYEAQPRVAAGELQEVDPSQQKARQESQEEGEKITEEQTRQRQQNLKQQEQNQRQGPQGAPGVDPNTVRQSRR